MEKGNRCDLRIFYQHKRMVGEGIFRFNVNTFPDFPEWLFTFPESLFSWHCLGKFMRSRVSSYHK